jgi:2-C-methyl-D-erythritol 4-phosphate cytidylyltransferase
MAIWAIVPAAGIGTRMNSEMPKQYLSLNGQSVIAHTLQRLAGLADLRAIVIALHPQDALWAQHGVALQEGLMTCGGGEQRCQSVLNGLYALAGLADADDWVLVHDAVRPCVRLEDIETLLREIENHPVGGLLGTPVSSTLKLANASGDIVATMPRDDMWQASTPQAFRYGQLREVLEHSVAQGDFVTDEAAAMEKAGYTPRLVRGGADNIKITYPDDLRMAGVILQAQAHSAASA